MPLTVKGIAKLKERGRYLDEHGLYLQVLSATNRSWLLRYERGGRERMMGLGPLHTFDLPEARERARAARKLLADGIDPLEARKAARAAQSLEAAKTITFKEAAQQYYNGHESGWHNAKAKAQFLSTLERYAFPVIGALSVAVIDAPLIKRVLEPIWTTKAETASRVRRRIEWVLDWATVNGYRTGDNPARWRGNLNHLLPDKGNVRQAQHMAALPYAGMATFITALRGREGIAARALEFLILTAARTGEVTGATWAEIDFGAKTWTIPKGRMKMKREHRVPLSAEAMAILTALPREGDYVFPGGRENAPLSDMGMTAVLRRMGTWVDREGRPVVVHGFRSCFRDWAGETTAYPNHVVEMALAHTVGGVEGAYRRGDLFDKRRRLMADWGRYCQTPAEQAEDNVRPMRGAA
jgi:integrase